MCIWYNFREAEKKIQEPIEGLSKQGMFQFLNDSFGNDDDYYSSLYFVDKYINSPNHVITHVHNNSRIIMTVFQGNCDSDNNSGQPLAPYAYLKNNANNESIKTLFQAWGIADHLVLIVNKKRDNLNFAWVEPVLSIPRMAKEYNCPIACFTIGEVFHEELDFTQIGVPVVYIIADVAEIDFENDVNVSKMCIGESKQNISRYTHFLFSEMSNSVLKALICENGPHISVTMDDNDTVSVTCKSNNSEVIKYQNPITEGDIVFDKQFLTRFFLTTIGSCENNVKEIFQMKGHSEILRIGSILPDTQLNSHHYVGKYFVQDGARTKFPLHISHFLPQSDSLVIINLENRRIPVQNVNELIVSVNEEIADTIFLLVDPHALLFTKYQLPKEQQLQNIAVAKRTIAITSVRAVIKAGIKWDLSNRDYLVETFPVPARNYSVGTYHIYREDTEDSTSSFIQDSHIHQSQAKKVINITFSEDEQCFIEHRHINKMGVQTNLESYKTHTIPTSNCLKDLILSSLIPLYYAFNDAPALVKMMENWDVTSDQYFEHSTLFKLALYMVDGEPDHPNEDKESSYYGTDTDTDITEETFESGNRSKEPACSNDKGTAWATLVPCIMKQLISAKQNLKSEIVTDLVTSVIMKYITMETPETAKICLKHPQARLQLIVLNNENKLLRDETLVTDILESHNAFWNIGLILCHLGRTTELRTILSFPHKCLVTYLLYSVGVLTYEMNQLLGPKKAYQHTEAHQRIAKCVAEFEQLAKDIVQTCFEMDKMLLETLLNSQAEHMDHNVLELALMMEAKPFLSNPACRETLNASWWLALADASWLKILYLTWVPCATSCEAMDNHTDVGWIGPDTTGCERRPSTMCDEDSNCPTDDESRVCQENVEDQHNPQGKKAQSNTSQCNTIPSPSSYIYDIPAVKCMFHFVSHCILLVLFSFMVLTGLQKGIDIIEYLVLVWILSLFAEELRQVVSIHSRSAKSPTSKSWYSLYINDFWNVLDVLLFSIYLIAFIFRIVAYNTEIPSILTTAHTLFIIDVLILFIRSLQFFCMHKKIGALLIMVKYMCYDLAYFMLVLLVILFGYGVALQAVLHPHAAPSWSLLFPIFQVPYQQIYGEIDIDDILAAPNASDILGPEPEPGFRNYFGVFLADCYLLFTNVLLLSLLIAMFNSSYERVKDDAEYHNVMHMNEVLLEYQDKSVLPPPLSVFTYIYHGIKRYRSYSGNNKVKNENSDTTTSRVDQESKNISTVTHDNSDKDNALLKVISNSVDNYLTRLQPSSDHSHSMLKDIYEVRGRPITMENTYAISEKLDTLNENHTKEMIGIKEQINRNEEMLLEIKAHFSKNDIGGIAKTSDSKEENLSQKKKSKPHKPKRQDIMNEILSIHKSLKELKSELGAQNKRVKSYSSEQTESD